MGAMQSRAGVLLSVALAVACSKKDAGQGSGGRSRSTALVKVGLVTDIGGGGAVEDRGGRGDRSCSGPAGRGVEVGAGEKRCAGWGGRDATAEEIKASIPPELANLQPPIEQLPIAPLVLQSKAQEDYEPNL